MPRSGGDFRGDAKGKRGEEDCIKVNSYEAINRKRRVRNDGNTESDGSSGVSSCAYRKKKSDRRSDAETAPG